MPPFSLIRGKREGEQDEGKSRRDKYKANDYDRVSTIDILMSIDRLTVKFPEVEIDVLCKCPSTFLSN